MFLSNWWVTALMSCGSTLSSGSRSVLLWLQCCYSSVSSEQHQLHQVPSSPSEFLLLVFSLYPHFMSYCKYCISSYTKKKWQQLNSHAGLTNGSKEQTREEIPNGPNKRCYLNERMGERERGRGREGEEGKKWNEKKMLNLLEAAILWTKFSYM